MYYLLVVLILLTLILGYTVTRYAQEGKKPPLNNSRIADKFLAGLAGGTVIALIPAFLFITYYPTKGQSDGNLGLFGIALMYLPVGYAIGSATGVYLVGNKSNETGSFLASLCGSLLVGLGVLGAIFLFRGLLGFISVVFIPVVLFGEPIVAIIIFNRTRKYKSSATPR